MDRRFRMEVEKSMERGGRWGSAEVQTAARLLALLRPQGTIVHERTSVSDDGHYTVTYFDFLNLTYILNLTYTTLTQSNGYRLVADRVAFDGWLAALYDFVTRDTKPDDWTQRDEVLRDALLEKGYQPGRWLRRPDENWRWMLYGARRGEALNVVMMPAVSWRVDGLARRPPFGVSLVINHTDGIVQMWRGVAAALLHEATTSAASPRT